MNTLLFRVAASLCFLAVALGAFGAHALKATLQTNGMVGVWDKAVLYHFVHALVVFALALHPDVVSRAVSYFFLSGIILFSGSLYLLALTNVRSLGAITPIGGLCFLIGWAWLVLAPMR